MKRSTFRKSTLISSVALLLVAIVALSGATFAWFSSNDTTSAEGIELTAAAASGLYITEDDAATLLAVDTAWSSTVDFKVSEDKMSPASSTFSSLSNPTFVKTTTDNADGSWNNATDENGLPKYPISNAIANEDYIVKHIWVKGDSTTATTLLGTINLGVKEGTAAKGYERCAVIDVTNAQSPVMVGNNIYAATEETKSYKGLTSSGASGSDWTPATAGTQQNIVTNWIPSEGRHFVIYCWFEGQDADCINTLSGANLEFDINFALPTTQG